MVDAVSIEAGRVRIALQAKTRAHHALASVVRLVKGKQEPIVVVPAHWPLCVSLLCCFSCCVLMTKVCLRFCVCFCCVVFIFYLNFVFSFMVLFTWVELCMCVCVFWMLLGVCIKVRMRALFCFHNIGNITCIPTYHSHKQQNKLSAWI